MNNNNKNEEMEMIEVKKGQVLAFIEDFEIECSLSKKVIMVKAGDKFRCEQQCSKGVRVTILNGKGREKIMLIPNLKMLDRLDYEQITKNIMKIIKQNTDVYEIDEDTLEYIKDEIEEELMTY